MKKSVVLFGLFIWAWLCLAFACHAQWVLSGQVSAEGKPLVGANVYVKGTTKGTFTNAEGRFALPPLPGGAYTLVCSSVGFQTVEKAVELRQHLDLAIVMQEQALASEEVQVYGTRLYPITNTIVSKAELAKQNMGQDLPVLLNFTPSLVSTSDAGAGVGYTGLRIRGSDPTRVNVTINGIPLNDSESQGVWWVNMPDFASTVGSLQIQRGVGTSVNGAGAFGASVNLSTDAPAQQAGAVLNNSVGSFGTRRHNLLVNSGLLGQRFRLMGRLSQIKSDGFIERAFSNLHSFYLSGVYQMGKAGQLTANVFSGKEQTYQAWYGVPEAELRQGNRRFNPMTYDNETDNYQQDHYQLIYDLPLPRGWKLNTALHYTRGRGYYEQFRENDALERYGLPPVSMGGQSIARTDLIRRRWLDNHFYGLTWLATKQSQAMRGGWPVIDVQWGGAFNRYLGKHFGEVIWARFASTGNIRHRYYDNDGIKTDFNTFAKASYQVVENLFVFADVQVRGVGYSFLGFDNQLRNVGQQADLWFFNPKTGLRYVRGGSEWYASYGVGRREPNRNDFTESSPASRPRHETLHNVEAGYQLARNGLQLGANLYYMYYRDQLVLTGRVNDVGAYIRQNIDRSHRLGLELQADWQLLPQTLHWQANLSLSRNKIAAFTEYVDDYDRGGQVAIEYQNTDIAFSPWAVAGSQLTWQLAQGFSASLLSKYVGKQYLDNTQDESRRLDAYHTHDLRLNYTLRPKWVRELGLALLLNNLLGHQYESNGYTYGYVAGGQLLRENFYFPQAGFHFLGQVSVSF